LEIYLKISMDGILNLPLKAVALIFLAHGSGRSRFTSCHSLN